MTDNTAPNNIDKPISSPIFGKTLLPDDIKRAAIKGFVDEYPVAVFQELGKRLNQMGLMISICAMSEVN